MTRQLYVLSGLTQRRTSVQTVSLPSSQSDSAPPMPTPEESRPRRRSAGERYSYRRSLSLTELVPAIGVAIGAGFFAFYITRLLLERTPLDVEPLPERVRRSRDARSPRVSTSELSADA